MRMLGAMTGCQRRRFTLGEVSKHLSPQQQWRQVFCTYKLTERSGTGRGGIGGTGLGLARALGGRTLHEERTNATKLVWLAA